MAELHVQRKRNNYWWVWILIIILIIAAVFYYYTNYYKKNNAIDNTTGFSIQKNHKDAVSSNFLLEVKNSLNDNSTFKRESHPVVFLN